MPAFDFSNLDRVIVLMLENRSFDHVLGSLRLEGKNVDGIDPFFSNLDSKGVRHAVRPISETTRASSFAPDVPHDADSVAIQMDKMGGFIQAYERVAPAPTSPQDVLAYYTRKELPITYFLADEFTVCDRWFSAIPTDTIPNRLYSVCGHSNGLRGGPKDHFLDMTSIFDFLDGDWAVYAGALPLILLIGNLTKHIGNAFHIRKLQDFVRDAQRGDLPRVTWIEPVYDYAAHIPTRPFGEPNDDHPPDRIELGQKLIAEVYGALISNPDVWNKSVLIVTYDEHGGFFDHVQPPDLAPEEVQADRFTTYGLRVPAIIVSPFAERGAVVSARFDHCSILKFILEWFKLPMFGSRIASANISSVAAALSATARSDRPSAPPPPVLQPARARALTAEPSAPPSDFALHLDALRLALQDKDPAGFTAGFPELVNTPPIAPKEQ
ncbi:MAG TPA: alkaline phosphatase family protein [Vicinamibacteria bacterium]|jgi:phospholipase C|nr:alkaline phosphatase family protein [Vicinamibacteria bacterium]